MRGHQLQEDKSSQPRRLAIDLHPLVAGVSGGIVPWIKGVLEAYVRRFPEDRLVLYHRPGGAPFRLDGANVEHRALADDPVDFHAELGRALAAEPVDVLIRSYPQERGPDFPWERQIVVIPDIQHEYLPELFAKWTLAARRRAFRIALSHAGAIATLTGHSRRTLDEDPANACPDIFEMPAALPVELAVDEDAPAVPAELAERFDRYFFMPANLWPHKNHRRLFAALREALPRLPARTGLVLTGNPDGWPRLAAEIGDLPVKHLGYVSHDRMRALFRHATALVYFSLFEGFGMPLLEAFHHGVPVLCSDTTSLPEVGGTAALACDPTDTRAMAALMIRIVDDAPLRAELVQRGRKRLAAYSWHDSAGALRAGCDRLLARLAEERPAPTAPRVGILVRHGEPEAVRRTIASIAAQSYQPTESVVLGPGEDVAAGRRRVGGTIYAQVAAGTVLPPDMVASVMALLRADLDIDIVCAGPKQGLPRLTPFWRKRLAERTGAFDTDMDELERLERLAAAGADIRFAGEAPKPRHPLLQGEGYLPLPVVEGLWARRHPWLGPAGRVPATAHFLLLRARSVGCRRAGGLIARRGYFWLRKRFPGSAESAKRLYARLRS